MVLHHPKFQMNFINKIFLYDFSSNKILAKSKSSTFIVIEIITITIFNANFFNSFFSIIGTPIRF